MPSYKRRKAPGGTYFFTLMLEPEAGLSFLPLLEHLRSAYRATHAELPFQTDAIVILPDHLHAVWTLPSGDHDYSRRWQRIKSRFTQMVDPACLLRESMGRDGERGLWKNRYWEHRVRTAKDLRVHLEYCWSDPVRHGFVRSPSDWMASSFHRDVRLGKVAADWCEPCLSGLLGKRNQHDEPSDPAIA